MEHGRATLEFVNKSEAELAVSYMNGGEIDGLKIIVEMEVSKEV